MNVPAAQASQLPFPNIDYNVMIILFFHLFLLYLLKAGGTQGCTQRSRFDQVVLVLCQRRIQDNWHFLPMLQSFQLYNLDTQLAPFRW